MSKLTKTIVDRAELREKQYTIWDSDLKGFGVFIHPTGTKTYFVDYRAAEGNRRRMTIGRHGSITTEQARKLAIETMGGIVLQRDDPLLERRTRRASLTVAELCDNYLIAARKGLIIGRSGKAKKSTTLETDEGRIERHIKPLLGRKLVIDMKRPDIAKFIRDVTAGKTALKEKSTKLRGITLVAGGAGTATRTTGLLGGILSYAVSEGIIESNPAHGVSKPAYKKRDRRLNAAEFRSLGAVLQKHDHEPWQAIVGIKLLALTGCRLGEIVKLKWEEVDLEGQALRLGDSKTGASIRPIGKPVVELLKTIQADRPTGFVLYGVRNHEISYGALDSAVDRLVKTAGLEGVTAHTLRHSFASVAADLNYSDSTIGSIIGHAGNTVTSRYTHRLDSVLIAAADKISEEIIKQMDKGN
ncbi:tyrosine-type recombinase/integrase [Pseudochrobactrum lubricantis]|uniref:tyrosine-type recombinase/integrase n=1 Tax=Pseudochrobactrum lubricantis TaxID=558172 RepID=UPI0035DBB2CF